MKGLIFLSTLLAHPVLAQSYYPTEKYLDMATEESRGHFFVKNPSMLNAHKSMRVDGALIRKNRTPSLTTTSPSMAEDRRFSSSKEDNLSAAFSKDLNGAIIGAGASFFNRASDVGRSTGGSGVSLGTEEYKVRDFQVKTSMEFTPEFHVGVLVKYLTVEGDVIGSYNSNENDKSSYDGSLFGYGAGMSFTKKEFSLGLGYVAQSRGKGRSQGESKILVEPGYVVLHGIFEVNSELKIGAQFDRWFYVRDDRRAQTTSPVEQRDISLLGLDIDRFIFNTQTLSIGADYLMSQRFLFRGSLARYDAEVIFNDNEVPGRDENKDNKFNYYGARISAGITANEFEACIGYGLSLKSFTLPNAITGGNGAQTKYKSQDTEIFGTLSAFL